MPFLRTKRIKFAVELIVSKLTDVSLLNARLFAKIRLLDCSSFEAVTEPKELRGHTCILYTPTQTSSAQQPPLPTQNDEDAENQPSTSVKPTDDLFTLTADQSDKQPFRFICRIPYNQESLRLDECRCKISIRRVERASKATKLGFVIINLSEFANATTPATQSFLLDGYTGRQRQDNSRVHIKVRMVNQMSDPLIKAPSQNTTTTNSLNDALNPQDRKVSHISTKKEEVRRRQDDGSERPGSAADSQIPQSTTVNSFSSSSTDSNIPITATPQNPRFSAPTTSERRTSVPTERASWAAVDLPSSASDYTSRLHQFSDLRRMSDDRIVVGASQNVPNRIQQTRRDADSVIEEVLAEAAVGLTSEDDEDERSNGDTLKFDQGATDDDGEPKKHLELFISKRNGDVYLGESGGEDRKNGQPRGNFERVRIESTE